MSEIVEKCFVEATFRFGSDGSMSISCPIPDTPTGMLFKAFEKMHKDQLEYERARYRFALERYFQARRESPHLQHEQPTTTLPESIAVPIFDAVKREYERTT